MRLTCSGIRPLRKAAHMRKLLPILLALGLSLPVLADVTGGLPSAQEGMVTKLMTVSNLDLASLVAELGGTCVFLNQPQNLFQPVQGQRLPQQPGNNQQRMF